MKNISDNSPLKPVKIVIQVPGSKSLSQRALLCNYLSGGKGQVIGALESDDTKHLRKALRQNLNGRVNLGNAGTAVRFLLPFMAEGSVITGDKHMQKRPVQDLLEAMSDLGIKTDCPTGCPPVKIVRRSITKKEVTIDASNSSQYLSSLLMLAPTLKQGLIIKTVGVVVSKPYIDLTLDVMEKYGIKVRRQGYRRFVIKHQQYKKIKYVVEADASSASYWLTYNHITDSQIELPNVNAASLQGDAQYGKALKQLKSGKSEFNFNAMPDVVMSMAIAAIFTDRKITIKNVANLRIKETDRLEALRYNLAKIGVRSKIGKDYIQIYGTNGLYRRCKIKSFDDHRIAMAFGLLGLPIDRPQCVNKSYPQFWQDYQKIKDANVVITGMRGTGKTTLGRAWAKQWQMNFIDLDQEVEKKSRQKIAQMVKQKGWKYFRDQEHIATKRYAQKKNTLIATGGGTVVYRRNYNLLKKHYTILLQSSIKDIAQRINQSKNRPALKGQNFVQELQAVWKERKDKYYQAADIIIKS